MSKAYDRINIYMLEKALQQIKMSQSFINLIKELFLGRQNQVFTAEGLSDPYDVLVEIDQGEIISLLLWCIYYDPLLSRIREQNIGYSLKTKQILNIYEGTTEDLEITFPGMAYMDDTNFIANDLISLEKILKMADKFYDLNDIQINKKKSELLLRSLSQNFNERITIKFG
jgi:hypothetical protein